jgi:type I restriction enzyme S subunit
VTVRRLKELVDPHRAITYGIVQAGDHVPDGIPYIRPIDMTESDGVENPDSLQRTSDAIAAAYRRSTIRAGDLVVSIGPSFGKVMVVPKALDGANLTQGTARVAPSPAVHPRFLYWALRSKTAFSFWEAAVGGATFRALNLGPLAETPIPVPPISIQRVIADYLDAETDRIDRMVAALTTANRLVEEWQHARATEIIWAGSPATAPLMHLARSDRQIQYGIVLPGPDVEDGVPIVKGGNLSDGVLGPGRLSKTSREIESGFARSRLQAGDIVFAIRGAVGACAIVPREVAGANITQDVAMVAPRAGVDPAWLLHVLRSRPVQGEAESRTVGATIRGLNIRDLKRLTVPLVGPDVQRRQTPLLASVQQRHDYLTRARSRQIDLLRERRQALITAAVTGQVEVPGVAA